MIMSKLRISLISIAALVSFAFNSAIAKDVNDFPEAKQILKFNLSTGQYGVDFISFNQNGAKCNYEKGSKEGLEPGGKLVCDIKDKQRSGFSVVVKNKGEGAAKNCTIKTSINKDGLSKSGQCGSVVIQEDESWTKDYLFGSWTANFQ